MATLSKKQDRDLRGLLQRLPNSSRVLNAENFILRYIAFESVCRKIWHFYRCRKRHQRETAAGVNIKELKKAFKHFYYDIDNEILDKLLDSKLTKRNNNSARNLRNGMVHSWKKEDCGEAQKRLGEFNKYFDEFLNGFGGSKGEY